MKSAKTVHPSNMKFRETVQIAGASLKSPFKVQIVTNTASQPGCRTQLIGSADQVCILGGTTGFPMIISSDSVRAFFLSFIFFTIIVIVSGECLSAATAAVAHFFSWLLSALFLHLQNNPK